MHAPSSHPFSGTAADDPKRGADHIAPDCAGQNFYAVDRGLRDLMDEAAAAGKDVSIHVAKFNPAMRLYRRLGFAIEDDKGVYDLMRWTSAKKTDRASRLR